MVGWILPVCSTCAINCRSCQMSVLEPTPLMSIEKVAYEISRLPLEDKKVLIGYSGGGSRAIWAANSLAYVKIDLLVLYDPSPTWQMTPINANVAKVICYHNRAPDLSIPFIGALGGGLATLATGNRATNLLVRNISEPHLDVQDDQALHAATIQAIKDLGNERTIVSVQHIAGLCQHGDQAAQPLPLFSSGFHSPR